MLIGITEDDYSEMIDKEQFASLLSNIKTIHLEHSWNETKIGAFCVVLNNELRNYYRNKFIKVEWTANKNEIKNLQSDSTTFIKPVGSETIITISADVLGHTATTELDVRIIYSPKCPTNLPNILANAFIQKINMEIQRKIR